MDPMQHLLFLQAIKSMQSLHAPSVCQRHAPTNITQLPTEFITEFATRNSSCSIPQVEIGPGSSGQQLSSSASGPGSYSRADDEALSHPCHTFSSIHPTLLELGALRCHMESSTREVKVDGYGQLKGVHIPNSNNISTGLSLAPLFKQTAVQPTRMTSHDAQTQDAGSVSARRLELPASRNIYACHLGRFGPNSSMSGPPALQENIFHSAYCQNPPALPHSPPDAVMHSLKAGVPMEPVLQPCMNAGMGLYARQVLLDAAYQYQVQMGALKLMQQHRHQQQLLQEQQQRRQHEAQPHKAPFPGGDISAMKGVRRQSSSRDTFTDDTARDQEAGSPRAPVRKRRNGKMWQDHCRSCDSDEDAFVVDQGPRKMKRPEDAIRKSEDATRHGPAKALATAAGRMRPVKRAAPQDCKPRKPRDPASISKVQECATSIMKMVGTKTIHERQIREALGNNPDTSKALRLLMSQGKLERCGAGGRGDPFSYRATAQGLDALQDIIIVSALQCK